ncbi:MAG: carboxypeptidase-like regulatory domain-containing protein, partial [Planctomycetota bacterium]
MILLVLDGNPAPFFNSLLCPGPNGPGLFLSSGFAALNFNTCMVQVEVTDKLPPILVNCPVQQRITCDWYAQNLEATLFGIENNSALTAAQKDQQQDAFLTPFFGSPLFYDNCNVIITPQVTLNIDQCLEGRIIRTWTARDQAGNTAQQSCVQTIFVDHVSDFVVEFPADVTINCGTDTPDFGEPEIFFETCELVAVSFDDQLFTVVADACFKLVRQWTVINWCVVGAEIDEEVIESSERAFQLAFPSEPCDFDGDGDCDTRTFRDSWRTSPKAKPGASNATQATNPDTDPDTDPWDGYITYQQVIKVQDTVDPVFTNGCAIPDVCINDNSCVATLILPTPEITECSPTVTITVQIQIGGVWLSQGVNGFGPYFNVAPGTYPVRYTAIDNCNNQTVCNTTVKVKDCKLPTPYCKAGIVVELMVVDPPMVVVWAVDLNDASFDNCPGALKFSFSPNVNDISKTYDCDDFGPNEDTLYVTDAAGNQDFCTTIVNIQANQGQCDDDPQVAGTVATASSQKVEGVNVSINSPNGFTDATTTNANGYYDFGSVQALQDYTITPVLDVEPLNGVSTFDLVLISKHI